jgi:hypothetical protein
MQRDNRPNSSFEKLPSLVQSARGLRAGSDGSTDDTSELVSTHYAFDLVERVERKRREMWQLNTYVEDEMCFDTAVGDELRQAHGWSRGHHTS